MDADAPPRLRPRFRWWLWLGGAGLLAAGVLVASVLLDRARAEERRDRIRAVLPELEVAVDGYGACMLPPAGEPGTPWPYQAWVAGTDVGALVQRCGVELERAVTAASEQVALDDRDGVRALVAPVPRLHHDGPEIVAEACTALAATRAALDELRARAGLARRPSPVCDATRARLDVPVLDRRDYPSVLDTRAELEQDSASAAGAELFVAGSFHRYESARLDSPRVEERRIARNTGGSWERVALVGDIARMRWADDGPWAVARRGKEPFRVSLHRDGAWSSRVVLPRITAVIGMRPAGDHRIVVGWQGDDLVVIRLDTEATRILETVGLGAIERRPLLAVTGDGAVTAVVTLDDGDAEVIHLAPGASAPVRTREAATGTAFDVCTDGRDVFLQLGARLLHSADGGASLSEVAGFGSLEWHHLACGAGWLAGLEVDGDAYVLCRDGACRRSPVTSRDFNRFALARHGGGVRVLAESYRVAVLWEDPDLSGSLGLHQVWDIDTQHTLLQIDGTWFHASAADPGAY